MAQQQELRSASTSAASVPSSWILRLGELLDEKGFSPQPILRRCGIDADLLPKSEGHVGLAEFGSLVTEALRTTGDHGLGLD